MSSPHETPQKWGVFYWHAQCFYLGMRNYSLTNTLFNDLFTNFDNSFFDGDHSYWRRQDTVLVKDTGNTYEYSMELAGFSKKDVEISFKDGIVKILAKKEENTKSCSFYIPKDADKDKIFAELKDGLLSITITKKEEVKAKQIKIK